MCDATFTIKDRKLINILLFHFSFQFFLFLYCVKLVAQECFMACLSITDLSKLPSGSSQRATEVGAGNSPD